MSLIIEHLGANATAMPERMQVGASENLRGVAIAPHEEGVDRADSPLLCRRFRYPSISFPTLGARGTSRDL